MVLRITGSTRKRYVVAYARLAEFDFCMGLLLSTFEAFGEAAAAYIEELWHSGDPKLWANDALASLHFYVPQARRRLPLGRALHGTWGRHEMPAQACPIGIDLLFGIAGGLVRAWIEVPQGITNVGALVNLDLEHKCMKK